MKWQKYLKIIRQSVTILILNQGSDFIHVAIHLKVILQQMFVHLRRRKVSSEMIPSTLTMK